MSPIIRLKALAAVAALTLTAAGPQALAQTIFIKGGTLIDGTGAAPVKDARILIRDGVIKGVWSGDKGGQSVPAGVPVVDATGKYLIPGLIDSHVHYNWYEGELFLHYGVTSVFDLGGGLWSNGMQKGVASGEIRAPRYYHHASFGDGANGKADKFAGRNTARTRAYANVNSPADAEAAVNAVVGKADIITLGEDWKGEVFSAIAKAAHARGLSIISHSYNALDTSDWGVDGIEHLTGVGMAATRSEAGKAAIAAMGICTHSYAPLLEQSLPCIAAGHKNSLLYRWMDTSYFDTMIAHLVKNHTYLNPTLDFEWGGIIDRSGQFELEDAKLLAAPNLDYVPEDEKKEFLDQYHWADGRSAEEKKEFLKGYRNVQLFLRKFVAAGGKLYSGTDSASANVPGLSLHHEMQIYVDAGISPLRALQSSTLWAAEMARLDGKIGSVVPGKLGDVVILDADPLQDIHNAQLVAQVIKGGVVQ
ncbi:MAG TPA: amidohydrolase family protein, partial [Bryobacteraceae bacterium]|nr:amidohydrolase family protein [Bryobacteraceae bacterium]